MVVKRWLAAEALVAEAAVEVLAAAAPAVIITTSGSIRPSRIAWPSLMMPALASQLHAGKAGRGFNCQTARSITSRPTTRFHITFTAIVRTARPIEDRAAQARAAVSVAVVAEEEAVSADHCRGALGLVSLAVRVAGLLSPPAIPIQVLRGIGPPKPPP